MFAPALEDALAEARDGIRKITENRAPATFDNTIVALETNGKMLDRVLSVFFNRAGTDANDVIKGLQREFSPKLSAYHSEVTLNSELFARIDALFEECDGLEPEAKRVLELYHRSFVRAGARLEGHDRDRLTSIMAELSKLGTEFSQNVQQDEEEWCMLLADDELAGLPDFVVSSTEAAAAERGETGRVVTLSRSLIVPFLESSHRRDLREKAYKAWVARGRNGDANDNRDIVRRILELRQERAKILGYESFSDFKLETEMAKTPETVRELLMAVWTPAKAQVERDAKELRALMYADGINGELEPWDWHFYAAKHQRETQDLDMAQIKPYLQLENIIEAAFDCAERLFGLKFKAADLPRPHKDAQIWEVEKNGRHMGVFIGDYFNRPSKRSGAWCSSFRSQSKVDGDVRPIVINVCNFAKPKKGQPALLTYDDARTLFHEFGHALHSLLSDVTYPRISGTSVARDFVELPSQLYEHWLSVPEILSKHARHAITGEAMPLELLEKLLSAENYGQGFATVEYVASALLDLHFHSGKTPKDPLASGREMLARIGMPSSISPRHDTTHFLHIFSSDGYSSGYYSYMWSEVMDADAFSAFEETGDPFDAEIAEKLEKWIYSAGGKEEAETLYLGFRGAMPNVSALLKQRGLVG
ncbi:M3 family metallopeptidase [Algicella marina]|nr:M3 family metallopeptidase [Algicella marina]